LEEFVVEAGAAEEDPTGPVGPSDVVSPGATTVTGAVVVVPIVLFDVDG
jgi:hypothetical protein